MQMRITIVSSAFFDETYFYQIFVAMHIRLLKRDFLKVTGSAVLRYGGY